MSKTSIGVRTGANPYKSRLIKILLKGPEVWNQWRKENPNEWIDLKNANLQSANLRGTNLRSANLMNADLRSADLSSADLGNADLINADLRGTLLRDAYMKHANLSKANLFNAYLANANISNSFLRETNLERADLQFTNLEEADLLCAKLINANLRNANLRNANLRNANLRNANLRNANLEGADLRGINLRNTDLKDTNFKNAKIYSNVKLLTEKLTSRFKKNGKEPENFEISLLHPRHLAKGFSSIVRVHIYFPSIRPKIKNKISDAYKKELVELKENRRESLNLKPGMTVIIVLSSPVIEFSSARTIALSDDFNEVSFLTIPKLECRAGLQACLLSIKHSETLVELESIPFSCQVDDYAFDHISRPLASYFTSGIAGLLAVIVGTLTFFGKMDKVMGVPAGTSFALIATISGIQPTWLYQKKIKVSDN